MDYAELVTETALRCGLPEIPARAAYFVTQAERDLEKALRVRQMETTATVTADAEGNGTLPADFLAWRSDGAESFPVTGNTFIAQPDQVVEMTYYRKLPSVVTNGTNWLLTLEPEIYVLSMLQQIYAAASDERLQATSSQRNERIRQLVREDRIARYGAQKIDYSGLMR